MKKNELLKTLVIIAIFLFISNPIYGNSTSGNCIIPEILKPLNIWDSWKFSTMGDLSSDLKNGARIYKENPDLIKYLGKKLEPEFDKLLKNKFFINKNVNLDDPIIDFNFVRNCSKTLSSLGIYLASKDKIKESLLCFRISIKLGVIISRGSFFNSTSLIQKMISIAIIKISMNYLYKTIYLYPVNLKELSNFNTFLINIRKKIIPISSIIKQEFFWIMNVVKTMKKSPEFKNYSSSTIDGYMNRIEKYLHDDTKPLIDLYLQICKTKYWKNNKLVKEYKIKEKKLMDSCKMNWYNPINWWTAIWDKPYIISRILISISYPNFLGALEQDLAMFAMIDGFNIALAAKLYKKKKGRYPSNFSELRKFKNIKYKKDPFTGKDFVIKVYKKEFLLYSKGSDGVDEDYWKAGYHSGKWDILLINGPKWKNKLIK